jgi:hypothetical protein
MNKLLKEFYEWLGWYDIARSPLLMWLMVILFLSIMGMILWEVYDALDNGLGQWHTFLGTVEGKKYEPSTRTTSVGAVANGSGGVSPVVMSSGSSEKWDLFVRDEDGKIEKILVSMQQYFDLKDGQKITFYKKLGRLSKKWVNTSLQH